MSFILDLIEIVNSYGSKISIALSRQFGFPINNMAVCLLFALVLFVTTYFYVDLFLKKVSKSGKRNSKVCILISILCLFFILYVNLSQELKKLRNADVIVAEMDRDGDESPCRTFSSLFQTELDSMIKPLDSELFFIPHKKFSKSILKNIIKNTDKPIVIIGGHCDVNELAGAIAIEFKVLKETYVPPVIDHRLNNGLNKFKISSLKSYNMHTSLAEASANSIKAVMALINECKNDCREAKNLYIDLINSLEKSKVNQDLIAFTFLRLAVIDFSLKNYKAVEKTLNQLLSYYPSNEEGLLNRGIFYFLTEKYSLAEKDFSELLESSKIEDVYVNLSASYLAQNKPGKVVAL